MKMWTDFLPFVSAKMPQVYAPKSIPRNRKVESCVSSAPERFHSALREGPMKESSIRSIASDIHARPV